MPCSVKQLKVQTTLTLTALNYSSGQCWAVEYHLGRDVLKYYLNRESRQIPLLADIRVFEVKPMLVFYTILVAVMSTPQTLSLQPSLRMPSMAVAPNQRGRKRRPPTVYRVNCTYWQRRNSNESDELFVSIDPSKRQRPINHSKNRIKAI